MKKVNNRTISIILICILGISLNVSADNKHHKSTFQTSNGIDITGGGAITAGTMIRTKQSVDASLSLSGLDTNSAYAVWWVVFNKPENCVYGPIADTGRACGGPGSGDVPDSVFYAAGFVTGNSGNANISVHLNAGKLPAGMQPGAQVRKPGMLKRGKGLKAEFHMVLHRKGPILSDLADQIGSFAGGCDINEGMCGDQAVIIFPAPKKTEETEETEEE